jgi:hypothetical protein
MSPQELLAGGHYMDDELDAFCCSDADFEHPSCVSSNQHHEIVQLEHSDRVSEGVEHVIVRDPVFAGTRHNHRIHVYQVSLRSQDVGISATDQQFLGG